MGKTYFDTASGHYISVNGDTAHDLTTGKDYILNSDHTTFTEYGTSDGRLLGDSKFAGDYIHNLESCDYSDSNNRSKTGNNQNSGYSSSSPATVGFSDVRKSLSGIPFVEKFRAFILSLISLFFKIIVVGYGAFGGYKLITGIQQLISHSSDDSIIENLLFGVAILLFGLPINIAIAAAIHIAAKRKREDANLRLFRRR